MAAIAASVQSQRNQLIAPFGRMNAGQWNEEVAMNAVRGRWSVVLGLLLSGPHLLQAQFNNGVGGAATTVQLPTFGVAIDAEGVLDVKTFSDPGGRLRLERMAAVKADMPADLRKFSKLRKISLRKLEA